MKKYTFFKTKLLVLLLLFIGTIAFGQSLSILKTTTTTFNQLNVGQQTNFQKFSTSLYYKNATVIQVENLAQNATDGKINLSLPQLTCSNLTFTASKVDYISENEYYWYGTINSDVDAACNEGSITLMAKNGRKFGTLLIDDNSYEFQDLGNGYQIFYQVKTEMFDENECGVNSTTPVSPDPIPNRTLPCPTDNQIVRVLVLWTQAAQNAEANINDRVNLAIAQTNQAYWNSSVGGGFNVQLAGSQLLAGFNETPNQILADVNRLSTNATAQNLRTAAQADLVVLLTNGNYGSTFGIVQAIGPSFTGAYSIVQTTAATGGRFTFAHEVGHLFGARHDNDPNGSIQHGYLFRTGFIFTKQRYTLLGSLPANKSRELNYSNPDVKIKNKATGTACCNNNAQQHRTTFPTISSFFANPGLPFNISMNVVQGPCCFPDYAEAITQCGTAPYTYRWETSFDGINYTYAGNGEVVYIGGCPKKSSIFFIRLTVTDANGQVRTTTSFRYINACYTNFAATTNTPANIIEEVFPNPSSTNGRALLNMPSSGNINLVVTDFYGNVKKIIHNGTVAKGRNLYYFNTANLIAGTYNISLMYNNVIETKQLIISR